MRRLKLRGRIRAPYLRFRDFVRSRLSSPISSPHTAPIPCQSTPPQDIGHVEGITNVSIRNGENSPSHPDDTHGTVSFDSQSTRTLAPSHDGGTFMRIVDISFWDEQTSSWYPKYTHGVVLFDTGSEYNLVTSQFLENNGIKWQPSTSLTSIFQMDGTEIKIRGEVNGRWYPLNASRGDNFPHLYPTSTFKVVDFESCELIIGRDTINELNLFQPNRSFFGAFRGVPIRVDPASVTIEKEREFQKKRQKEQEEMKKAEEEQARKAKTSKPQPR